MKKPVCLMLLVGVCVVVGRLHAGPPPLPTPDPTPSTNSVSTNSSSGSAKLLP